MSPRRAISILADIGGTGLLWIILLDLLGRASVSAWAYVFIAFYLALFVLIALLARD